MHPSKEALKRELVAHVAAELETVVRAHRSTAEGATHAEAKPENDKDTRALEQSYLARGQALRVEELRAALAEVEAMSIRSFREGQPAAIGALITVEDDAGAARAFFLAAHGGGATLSGGVQVVTPKSPLGRALLGKREGDEADVEIAGKRRELTVVAVA